jgi:hypothetical protein
MPPRYYPQTLTLQQFSFKLCNQFFSNCVKSERIVLFARDFEGPEARQREEALKFIGGPMSPFSSKSVRRKKAK